jgi:hypothetical protein
MKQSSAWAVGGRIRWLVNPQLLVAGGYTGAHYDTVKLDFLVAVLIEPRIRSM